ncbi:MAG: PIG-L family deacetylase [Candidatus Helarchaeota archaeon]|nr:PIG-L family deacetylase [Candidatus Helarchaeota archaeon]
MKVLFVCAHPDDLEFYVSNILISLAKTHAVKILSMTGGEYGTHTPELTGKKLAGIRKKELLQAAKIEGVTQVDFAGYLDGHLVITREVLGKIKAYLEAYRPDVVFAPECFYYFYPHDDHIRSGLIMYHLIQQMPPNKRPKLFLYHSYVNTHYFPMKHWRTQSKALKMHKSQYWLLLPMYPIRFLIGFWFGFRLPRAMWARTLLAEAVRRVDYQADLHKPLEFKQRLFGRIVMKLKNLVKPMLEDLEKGEKVS